MKKRDDLIFVRIQIGRYRVVYAYVVSPIGDGLLLDEINPETNALTGTRYFFVDGKLLPVESPDSRPCPICGSRMSWLSGPLSRYTGQVYSPGDSNYLPVYECDNPTCRKTVDARLL